MPTLHILLKVPLARINLCNSNIFHHSCMMRGLATRGPESADALHIGGAVFRCLWQKFRSTINDTYLRRFAKVRGAGWSQVFGGEPIFWSLQRRFCGTTSASELSLPQHWSAQERPPRTRPASRPNAGSVRPPRDSFYGLTYDHYGRRSRRR